MRLALSLGKSLSELLAVPCWELPFWLAFEQTRGLPDSRQEASIALGCAAVAGSNGSKVKPKDLIPVFTQPVPWETRFAAWAEERGYRVA